MIRLPAAIGFTASGLVYDSGKSRPLHCDDGRTLNLYGYALEKKFVNFHPYPSSGYMITIPGAPNNVPGARASVWVAGTTPYVHGNNRLHPYVSVLYTTGVGHTFVVPLYRLNAKNTFDLNTDVQTSHHGDVLSGPTETPLYLDVSEHGNTAVLTCRDIYDAVSMYYLITISGNGNGITVNIQKSPDYYVLDAAGSFKKIDRALGFVYGTFEYHGASHDYLYDSNVSGPVFCRFAGKDNDFVKSTSFGWYYDNGTMGYGYPIVWGSVQDIVDSVSRDGIKVFEYSALTVNGMWKNGSLQQLMALDDVSSVQQCQNSIYSAWSNKSKNYYQFTILGTTVLGGNIDPDTCVDVTYSVTYVKDIMWIRIDSIKFHAIQYYTNDYPEIVGQDGSIVWPAYSDRFFFDGGIKTTIEINKQWFVNLKTLSLIGEDRIILAGGASRDTGYLTAVGPDKIVLSPSKSDHYFFV